MKIQRFRKSGSPCMVAAMVEIRSRQRMTSSLDLVGSMMDDGKARFPRAIRYAILCETRYRSASKGEDEGGVDGANYKVIEPPLL